VIGRTVRVAVAAAVALCAACSSPEEANVDETLTEAAASEHLVGYFTETLSALPEGVVLRRTHPQSPTGAPLPGGVTPCDDNDTTATGPVFLTLGYWVDAAGAPTATSFDTIATYWDGRGWPLTDRSAGGSRTTVATLPDGYRINVHDNGRGGLSVSGVSPCFPRENASRGDSQPAVIERP